MLFFRNPYDRRIWTFRLGRLQISQGFSDNEIFRLMVFWRSRMVYHRDRRY